MEDPLFGLSFDPTDVQFEQLAALPCAASAVQSPPYFVFAHARKGGTAVWILNHWTPTGGDGPGEEHTEPALGIVIQESNGDCELIATPDALHDRPELLEPSVARALYRDASRRYVTAYRTADALSAALAALSARGCIQLAPALRRALRRASVAPPPECTTQLSKSGVGSFAAPVEVVDPILGVSLRWSDLPEYRTRVLGHAGNADRRQLASVRRGQSQIVLVLSIHPIEPDGEQPGEIQGYEVDSGQLVKHFGNRASPLGASSGDLARDYPEIKTELLADLLINYVGTVLQQYESAEQLQHDLAHSQVCTDFDSLLLSALKAHALESPVCRLS